MAHSLTWLVNQRVISLKIAGAKTVSEATEILLKLDDMAAEGQSPVHILIDLLEVQHSGFPLSALPALAKFDVRNIGWTAFVVRNTIVKMIATIAIRLTGRSFKVFPTRELAIEFLLTTDPTLKPN